jgi:photosystem II stability/assembly factor-like uncharacterized protein
MRRCAMKSILIVRVIVIAAFHFAMANAQSGWYRQNVPSNGSLLAVCFTDANNGTVVGTEQDSLGICHPLILRTTNGGAQWSRQLLLMEGGLCAVSLTDPQNGTAVGWSGELVWYGISNPLILRTTDYGTTWTSQLSDSGYTLYGVCFADANTGTAVGWNGNIGGGKILRTTDGGTTWTHQSSGTDACLNSVCFTDRMTGTVVGWGGTILRTTDGGSTWIAQSSGVTLGGCSFESVSFSDATTGTVVGSWRPKPLFGDFPLILRTTDGGATWTHTLGGITALPYGVCFVDAMTGIIVGRHDQGAGTAILRTTDGGINWTPQSIGPTDSLSMGLYSVSFCGPDNGTAVGWEMDTTGEYSPLILHTTTGGISSISSRIREMPISFSLSQNYPNPFNPTTTIKYELPKASQVILTVYDILGREVSLLVNERRDAGVHEAQFDGSNLASGVYLYRLQAGDFTQTKRLLLLK